MLSFSRLSAKARLAAAAGATLLAAGLAAGFAIAPAAYAGTASGTMASSAQAVAANPGAAATSDCTGRTKAHADHNHVGLTFWYRPDGCIGTVKVTVYEAAAHACIKDVEIRIYGNGHRDREIIIPVPAPIQCGGTVTTFTGIKQIFPNPVEVCARSATTTGGRLGPACVTVN